MRGVRPWLWPAGIGLAIAQILAGLVLAHLRWDLQAQDVAKAYLIRLEIGLVLIGIVLPALTLVATGWLHRRLSKAAAAIIAHANRAELNQADESGDRVGALPGVADAVRTLGSRLHERIRLLEARLGEQRIIQESMSAGMAAIDLDQRVLSMNKAAERLLKLSAESVKGRPLRETMHEPGLNQLVSQAIAQAQARDPRAVGGEVELFRTHSLLQVSIEPLRSADGKIVGLLLLLSDVTRLRHLEKIRTDFAANVSHELRTPITNIKGYLETLLETAESFPEPARAHLGVIKRNADRLELIVEDLLKLARLEDPDAVGALEKADAELGPILESAAAAFDEARAAKQIDISVEAPPGVRAVVNAQLIEQAVGNLLSNALKYSPVGSSIALRAATVDPQSVEICVIDHGPGIAPEHLPRLFERFYRVDRARSRELGGTGLGLAIVKHIAQVHGGRAEVESKPGRGSTFRIVLPATGRRLRALAPSPG